MRIREISKKITAYACVAALALSGMTGVNLATASDVKADEGAAVVEDVCASDAAGNLGEVAEYLYKYAWLGGATSEHKYMAITYTGDISNLRIQGVTADETRLGVIAWMNQEQGDRLTLVGEEPVLSSEEGATVIIDLEASGINLDECVAIDMHYGPGTLNIGYVRLSATPEVKDVDSMPKEDIYVDGAVGDLGEVAEYLYKYGWLCGATSDYKYMAITYTGDISSLRIQGVKADDSRVGVISWMNQEQGDHLTLVGEEPVLSSEEGATVVIDLEASGINLDECVAMDMHYGPGKLNIGYVRLSTSPDVKDVDAMPKEDTGNDNTDAGSDTNTEKADPSTGIQLNGDDKGDSAMNGTYTVKFNQAKLDKGEVSYTYVGYVTFNDLATPEFKYLKFTYKGDITGLRFEFNQNPGNDCDANGPVWFDSEQARHFVTVDGSAIPLVTDTEVTVTLDLVASGIDLSKYYSGFHMHDEVMDKDATFTITDAVLYGGTKAEPKPDIKDDKNDSGNNTTVKPLKLKRTKVKKVVKAKRSSKKVKITLKKIANAKGYQVKVSTTKKFKKKNTVTKKVKKVKFTIKSKKIKGAKKLYIKARAYNGKTYGNWSKVKKYKVKK